MSIMDFFRPGTAPTPQATPQQQQQPTAAGQQQTAPTPSLTQEPVAADPAAQVDPMDKFKELWAPNKPVEGAPAEFNPSAIFDMNPESVAKAVGGINFAEGITSEQLQAITAGGEDALKTFATILNQSSAKAMTLATTASAKMIEKALTDASGAMDKKINTGVKLNQVNSQLQELNPALSSPAAAPMVQALTSQLTNKFPTASATEIKTLVTEYMTNFAELAAGKKEPVADPATAGKTDWDVYMNS
jgi:hypothetical protein